MSHAHVEDEMTHRAVSVKPTDRLYHAFALMRRKNVRHLPVVGDDGMLAGILSDRDFMAHGVVRNGELIIGNHMVKDAMTTGVHTCRRGDRIGDVAEEMVRRRIDALPVVDESGQQELGIITATDLLLYLRRTEGVSDQGAVVEAKVYEDDGEW